MKKFLKIFIFDFDGVIINSDIIKYNIFRNLFKNEKQNIQTKILRYHFINQGINRIQKFEFILKNILRKKNIGDELKSLEIKFNSSFNKKLTNCKFEKGSIQILKYLRKKKIPTYIATGVKKNQIDLIIKKLKLKRYFSEIYGFPLKKSDIIKKITKKNNAKNSNIYFIGDSLSDMKAAKISKINFLGKKTYLNAKLLGPNKIFKESNVFKLVKNVLD